jgi:GNAT superfamily N-acetyltransferase
LNKWHYTSEENMDFIEKTIKENDAVSKIIGGWGSDILVSRGKTYKAEDLDGILVYENGRIVGLGLYYIKNYECEMVLLETFVQNKGIGTKIIEKIKEIAKINNCKRIWLITSNDNITALKFYQKRGFYIANIYKNAMEESRRIKPSIPKIAENGIEIRDEIEFEIKI